MHYRIVSKEAFKVKGKIIKVSTKDGAHHKLISEFWDQCYSDGTCEKLVAIDPKQNLLGICIDFDNESEQLSYMIAIADLTNSSESGLDTREIPAATWAIFTSIGSLPTAIQNVWERIFREWFPTSGFEHANAPELEVYYPGNPSAPDYRCEVWVPIVKGATVNE